MCFYSFPDLLHAGFPLFLNFQNTIRTQSISDILAQKEPMKLWNRRKRRKSRSFAVIIQMLGHTCLYKPLQTNEEFFLINFKKQVADDFTQSKELNYNHLFFFLQTLIFCLEAFETIKKLIGESQHSLIGKL